MDGSLHADTPLGFLHADTPLVLLLAGNLLMLPEMRLEIQWVGKLELDVGQIVRPE